MSKKMRMIIFKKKKKEKKKKQRDAKELLIQWLVPIIYCRIIYGKCLRIYFIIGWSKIFKRGVLDYFLSMYL